MNLICKLRGHIFTKQALENVGLLQTEGFEDKYNVDFVRICYRCGDRIDLRFEGKEA